MGDRLRIVVLGYVIRGPLGGNAWSYLHYPLGFAALDHDVVYLEDSGDVEWCCYDPASNTNGTDPSYGLAFAADAFDRVGLGSRWSYHDAHSGQWQGPLGDRMLDICAGADLVVNVSGANVMRPWLQNIPCRIFIDTDPAFEQIRQTTEAERVALGRHHNVFFTFGGNVGNEGCKIPDDGLPWRSTRQPIALKFWPQAPPQPHGSMTTVMQWESYPALEHQGVSYGMKSQSFNEYSQLPTVTGPIFEIALGSPGAPKAALMEKGWKLSDPLEVTRSLRSYQRYIQQSKAEFSVAKHGYVVSRSGWFSERTAAYLASGRPAIVQDTGFSDWLDVGDGLAPFSTFDEAAAAVEDVNMRYEEHCRGAREIAEEYFDSRLVLAELLDQVLTTTNGQ